jgi:O-succinylbenzoate synthase
MDLMNIKRITLYKVALPMITSFTISHGTLTEKPTVIVKVETAEGITGYGEAAAMPVPMYNHETVDTCMVILKNHIAPLVLNKQIHSIEEVMNLLSVIKRNNMSKEGLETALWMIRSIQEQRSLKDLLGGTREKIPVGMSIGIQETVEATLAEVQHSLERGYRRIKLKIRPGWDVSVVEAVRKAFGEISLMVDANSAYTLDDIETLQALDQYHLLMIEQPLADDDLVDHAFLQSKIQTPVCLDESICSAEDARKAISIGACKIINIKPARVGGLLESKKIHDLAEKHGVGVWCGGMMETTIGRAFNLAIASLPNYIYPADMSSPAEFYGDDLTKTTFTMHNGFTSVTEEVGLGYEVNEEKIDHYTVEQCILNAS